MMRKKKYDPAEVLRGKTITVVARKNGKEKYKDMVYEEAIKAGDKFKKLGYQVTYYQQGFYAPTKDSINAN